MKVLVVCQYYYPEPFRINDICESLISKGHEVTVITGIPNYPEGEIYNGYQNGGNRMEQIKGVNVIRCFQIARGKNNIKLFTNYLSFVVSASIKSLLLKEKFDVVFVNQLSPILMAIPAILYKNKHKKKLLLYCLDLWPESLIAGGVKKHSLVYKIFKIISIWIYTSADSILVSSSMFKEYFNSTLNIKTDNIAYLPQYAENLFLNCDKDKLQEKCNFVFAGNIGDMQSVDTIIKVAHRLDSNDNIIFHIIGDGSKLEECKTKSKELNLKNIIFYGRLPLSDMPRFYKMADAMIITLKDNKNISFTLPGKLQSYMAAGKPVIGAINGEANKVIKEANCGFVCNAEDDEEMSKLVLDYYNCEPDLKKKMSENARRYYDENFSKERFMSNLEKKIIELGDI